ncbi:MAG: hypothetical protein LBJ59_00560, partial [Zoogloeaceae bacterium]|jgi:hypothetical protein|nr:hypothetical protein [Zoogloeaceae bacterium]
VDTLEAKAAIAVKQQLEEQRIKSPPWNLQRISANGKESPAIPTDISAFDFLVWLRNASCHGDARTVCAVNNGNRLVGFGFQNKLNGKTTYSCVLKEVEIRRIGRSLASLYCEAFQEASGQSLGFTDEAVRERVEHATTDRH